MDVFAERSRPSFSADACNPTEQRNHREHRSLLGSASLASVFLTEIADFCVSRVRAGQIERIPYHAGADRHVASLLKGSRVRDPWALLLWWVTMRSHIRYQIVGIALLALLATNSPAGGATAQSIR